MAETPAAYVALQKMIERLAPRDAALVLLCQLVILPHRLEPDETIGDYWRHFLAVLGRLDLDEEIVQLNRELFAKYDAPAPAAD